MIGETVLKRLELVGTLNAEERAAVLGMQGKVQKVRAGEDMLREGERPTTSVVVLTGFLYRYKLNPDGGRQIHSFYMPTDTPCFETIPMEVMDSNLGAIVASEVGVITHEELCRVMGAHPRVLNLIWRETLIQGAIFREWMMRNSQLLAHAQIAHFFCEMMLRARAAGINGGDTCDLPISQIDLSDAIGMTPVHVNRTLQVLRSGGLVEFHSGKLTVPDLDRLLQVAEFDASYLHLPARHERANA